jgi:hypothetical protein
MMTGHLQLHVEPEWRTVWHARFKAAPAGHEDHSVLGGRAFSRYHFMAVVGRYREAEGYERR